MSMDFALSALKSKLGGIVALSRSAAQCSIRSVSVLTARLLVLRRIRSK